MPRKPKTLKLVTKEWLASKVEENPARTIGRALVALFRYQTEEEKNSNFTKFVNGVGFSANDARLGCIGAKYYMKHGTLSESLLKGWMKKDKNNLPRITKYVRQLNLIAVSKLTNNVPDQTTHASP